MIAYVYWSFVILGLLLAIVRIVFGPKIEDRIAALDSANIIGTGMILLLALHFKNELYLDVALIYAVLSFMETVVFARIIEKRKELY